MRWLGSIPNFTEACAFSNFLRSRFRRRENDTFELRGEVVTREQWLQKTFDWCFSEVRKKLPKINEVDAIEKVKKVLTMCRIFQFFQSKNFGERALLQSQIVSSFDQIEYLRQIVPDHISAVEIYWDEMKKESSSGGDNTNELGTSV